MREGMNEWSWAKTKSGHRGEGVGGKDHSLDTGPVGLAGTGWTLRSAQFCAGTNFILLSQPK